MSIRKGAGRKGWPLLFWSIMFGRKRKKEVMFDKLAIVATARGCLFEVSSNLESPFVSKRSVSPAAISIAAIALIDASSKDERIALPDSSKLCGDNLLA